MNARQGLFAQLRAGITELGSTLRDHLGIGRRVRKLPIRDAEALRVFLETRASFIAQTSLYGYLRTRAGQRYPQLFADDGFVVSINVAKWHLWLACLSDLTVYAGGLMLARSRLTEDQVGELMRSLLAAILDANGTPDTADAATFTEHADRVRGRIASTRWDRVGDGEACFHESPSALVRWAPIVEHLKRLDEDIVRNSVRYHWQEVRRDLRELLDTAAVAAEVSSSA